MFFQINLGIIFIIPAIVFAETVGSKRLNRLMSLALELPDAFPLDLKTFSIFSNFLFAKTKTQLITHTH